MPEDENSASKRSGATPDYAVPTPQKRNGVVLYKGQAGWHWQVWHDGEWLSKSTRPYKTAKKAREAVEEMRNNMAFWTILEEKERQDEEAA